MPMAVCSISESPSRLFASLERRVPMHARRGIDPVRRVLGVMIAAAGLASCSPRAEPAGWLGGSAEISDRSGDAAVAAGSVRVIGVVRGDVLIASGDIQILGDVGGDIRAVAGQYEQTGTAKGEVSLAAGSIVLDGVVGDDFWAIGEDVELRGESRIDQDARLAGEDVLIKGRIDGDLDVVADQVAIDAQIGGDVVIDARRIVIGPDATINGQLRWRSQAAPIISPDAIIQGGVNGKIEKPPPWRWRGQGGQEKGVFANTWLQRLAIAFSAFLLGAIILIVAPKWTGLAVSGARQQPGRAILAGIAAMTLSAILLAILGVSIVGLPVALVLLFALPLAAAIAFTISALGLGGLLLELAPRRSTKWGHLVLGVSVLSLAGILPWIGGLVAPGAICFGLGGALLARLTQPGKG